VAKQEELEDTVREAQSVGIVYSDNKTSILIFSIIVLSIVLLVIISASIWLIRKKFYL